MNTRARRHLDCRMRNHYGTVILADTVTVEKYYEKFVPFDLYGKFFEFSGFKGQNHLDFHGPSLLSKDRPEFQIFFNPKIFSSFFLFKKFFSRKFNKIFKMSLLDEFKDLIKKVNIQQNNYIFLNTLNYGEK